MNIKDTDQEKIIALMEVIESQTETNLALIVKLQQSEDREQVLSESFNSLVELCQYEANFKNGNSFNGVDEGDVLCWRFINQLKEAVKALKQEESA